MPSTTEPLGVLVAANVRAELARRKIRQRVLAEKLGRSQPWLSRRMNGETAFTLDELQAIAAVIGVDVAQLVAVAA